MAVNDPRWCEGFGDVNALCRAAALAALAQAGLTPPRKRIELSILLADDVEMRRLNGKFSGIDKATNVMAFPGEESADNAPGARLLGDVALGYETVCREAREQDKTAVDHLSHLVVHGCLHLSGYDHHTDADATRMEAKEIAALAQLGRPDPYRSDALAPRLRQAGR
jgi:probable rRNA maturation factor